MILRLLYLSIYLDHSTVSIVWFITSQCECVITPLVTIARRILTRSKLFLLHRGKERENALISSDLFILMKNCRVRFPGAWIDNILPQKQPCEARTRSSSMRLVYMYQHQWYHCTKFHKPRAQAKTGVLCVDSIDLISPRQRHLGKGKMSTGLSKDQSSSVEFD